MLELLPSTHVPVSSFVPMSWPEYVATKALSPRMLSWKARPADCPVIVTEPGAHAGPTPQIVPLPVTADPAVASERLMLDPAGFALNCHPHWPLRLALGESPDWPHPTVVPLAKAGRRPRFAVRHFSILGAAQ